MRTLGEILRECAGYLRQKGIENARRESEDLLSDALGLSRLDLYAQHDRPLMEEELAVCRLFLKSRGEREPLAYIHGKVDFGGCVLQVTPAVLIPRQETELLVSLIGQQLERSRVAGKTLWDICTGSGCIGIALKHRFPELNVVLSDLSGEALAVASRNATENRVDVTLRQGDLLAPFAGERADFIVCNPPYVSAKDYEELAPEVVKYEPKLALVGGESGLDAYKVLAEKAPSHLHPQGQIWLEMGHDQGAAITALFGGRGEVLQDWAGKDRFFHFFSLETE